MEPRESQQVSNDRLQRVRINTKSPSGSGRGMSRQELADAANRYLQAPIDAKYIGKLERGVVRWPRKSLRDALRRALGADQDSDLGFYVDRPQPSAARGVTATGRQTGMDLEPLAMIASRIRDLGKVEDAAEVFDAAATEIVDRYEAEGPAELWARAAALHKEALVFVETAGRAGRRPLGYGLAAKTSGLLAYMAVNAGLFKHADAYAREAFVLAEAAGDQSLMAWIRATQSFAAYYRSAYAMAADLAADGLRYSPRGAHALRLYVNGAARALAFLPGERRNAERAVSTALVLADQLDAPAGISSCISFGIYSRGRVIANAITVFNTLNDPHRVDELVEDIRCTVDQSESSWSRSLVHLDHAMSLVQRERPDIERAVAIASEALAASADTPITSVLQRSGALVRAIEARADPQAANDLRDRVRTLNGVSAATRPH